MPYRRVVAASSSALNGNLSRSAISLAGAEPSAGTSASPFTKEVLEHTRCRAGGGYKFLDIAAVDQIFAPAGHSRIFVSYVKLLYSVAFYSRAGQFQIREAGAEVIELSLELRYTDTLACQLLRLFL